MSFFVYLVESPSDVDFYHARSEGELVSRAIALDGIPCFTRTAINYKAFIASLSLGLPDAMRAFPDAAPILHLSAHGSKTGVQLSSGEEITWADLRDLITPVNESLQGTLLLCMSACNGYSACRMAMRVGNVPHPYLAMVGSYGNPTWSDTAAAYSAFYHHLAKGRRIEDAVEAMKVASGDHQWVLETAEQSKRGFIEYLQRAEPSQAIRELESNAESSDTAGNAKAWVSAPIGPPAPVMPFAGTN